MTHDTKNNRTDILVIVLGFTIIGLLIHNTIVIWSAVGVGALSLMFGWFETGVLWVWNKIAQVMGWGMSKLLLGIVFYVFLTPLSFLKKISGSKDSLRLKEPAETNWVERNHTFSKEDLAESF